MQLRNRTTHVLDWKFLLAFFVLERKEGKNVNCAATLDQTLNLISNFTAIPDSYQKWQRKFQIFFSTMNFARSHSAISIEYKLGCKTSERTNDGKKFLSVEVSQKPLLRSYNFYIGSVCSFTSTSFYPKWYKRSERKHFFRFLALFVSHKNEEE